MKKFERLNYRCRTLGTYVFNLKHIIQSASSDPSICHSGVPQGSVLSPLLLSLFISPIGQLVSDFGISHQQYADDAQLYAALKSSGTASANERLESCLTSLHCWLYYNGLCLNPDKSEAIIFGTHQRLRTFSHIICECCWHPNKTFRWNH